MTQEKGGDRIRYNRPCGQGLHYYIQRLYSRLKGENEYNTEITEGYRYAVNIGAMGRKGLYLLKDYIRPLKEIKGVAPLKAKRK